MKKLIALLLAACLMLGLMTTAFAAGEKSNDIVILHTDDAHCGVTDGLGYAGVAAYKAKMEELHNYVALVDCGVCANAFPFRTTSRMKRNVSCSPRSASIVRRKRSRFMVCGCTRRDSLARSRYCSGEASV